MNIIFFDMLPIGDIQSTVSRLAGSLKKVRTSVMKRVVRPAEESKDWVAVAAANSVIKKTAHDWVRTLQPVSKPRGGKRFEKVTEPMIEFLIGLIETTLRLPQKKWLNKFSNIWFGRWVVDNS